MVERHGIATSGGSASGDVESREQARDSTREQARRGDFAAPEFFIRLEISTLGTSVTLTRVNPTGEVCGWRTRSLMPLHRMVGQLLLSRVAEGAVETFHIKQTCRTSR